MDAAQNRVAQVFFWKQGTPPDLDYARQVLSVVNPEAHRSASGENPPVRLFSISGPWPDDPWSRALSDMRAMPAPNGAPWTDTNRYDLSGWQGTDSRSGDKIFIVTAYRRSTSAETIHGEGVQAPAYASPVAQVPYYPQYPTGPLLWPQQTQPQQAPQYVYPAYSGAQGPAYPQQGSYPYGALVTGPLVTTGPLPNVPAQVEYAPASLPDSYAPYYVGFGERLWAAMIDLFFMSWFIALTAAGIWWAGTQPQPIDFAGWLGLYGPFICLGLLIVVVYHVVGWSVWGRTFGKKLLGIKVVGPNGEVPGFGRSLLRIIGYFFSGSILGWGFLLVALDARRQGLHDKMAETYVVPDNPVVPAPPGLPGYRGPAGALPAPGPRQALPAAPVASAPPEPTPAIGMAAVAGPQPYGVVQVAPPPAMPVQQPGATPEGRSSIERHPEAPAPPQMPQSPRASGPYISTSANSTPLGPVTDLILSQAAGERAERSGDVEKARAFYKAGLGELESGVRRGYTNMEVEPGAARAAAALFRDALELVPTAVTYRYFYAVALRYSEGFEVAIGEFRRVLELDPGHYEARQQVAFGPRWHDAFAYPAWGEHLVEPDMPLPDSVRALFPQPQRPGTRLVLLREDNNKMVVALSRTRRDTWSSLPTAEMPARIELVLTRTPAGPIIALYVVVRDDDTNPYKGETFLNPHDPGQPSDDACQLGQHMLSQLARQNHSYLVFVDEHDHLLLSRKLIFDASTQVNIARVLYEVQSLPPQVMDPARFQQAAQWHMEHFSLDQIK